MKEFEEDSYGNVILDENQFDELVRYLEGSSKSLQDACNTLFELDFDDISMETLERLDRTSFECRICGWWSEISCMGEDPELDWVCKECTDNINKNKNTTHNMSKLLKFEQPNCVPCKNMGDYLDAKGVTYETVVPFDNPELAGTHRVRTVPVLIKLDEDGNEIGRTIGFKPAEIETLIKD